MKAHDIMVAPVITVSPDTTVRAVAETFVRHRISAAPVVDGKEEVVGIVSEGDLLHRAESGTERHRSWWLRALVGPQTLAGEYVMAHARKVADVMTRRVISASPDTPLHEIATLLEKHSIKRVPILDNDHLVGIVSRANLVQAVATAGEALHVPVADSTIRDKILAHLKSQEWAHTGLLNVTVNGGVVDLWGIVRTANERKAIRVAAEATAGVNAVNDNLRLWAVGGYE
jgi:CBS-domain-containing membrane protein